MRHVSPLTHIEDEEAEGAEDNGPHLLPVHGEAIPLRLVLQHKSENTELSRNRSM